MGQHPDKGELELAVKRAELLSHFGVQRGSQWRTKIFIVTKQCKTKASQISALTGVVVMEQGQLFSTPTVTYSTNRYDFF